MVYCGNIILVRPQKFEQVCLEKFLKRIYGLRAPNFKRQSVPDTGSTVGKVSIAYSSLRGPWYFQS